ncbi:MAG: undecaprenyldiphospho-muramoylpentapeptide beta-N-acetylglucosaminyltransferase [Clostridiales bacterium]|nr:undecaprenyldiphospho-muramoylpentapeptide beta-N-acetylglucosaminyltransferase [Clostridiales bacterium]
MTRLILTGGGTGGHIYPALAIGDGIKRRWPGTEIFYIGTKGGMESRIVPEAGYPFRGITAEGWQGRKIRSLASALRADHRGRREAANLLGALKPQAVIGTGGYVCLPVALAAIQKHIPVFIHEPNAFPGLTNRIISAWAKGIMVSFEEAAGYFPPHARKRVEVTGLPVRESIADADREEAYRFYGLGKGRVTILAAGGSQGAARINQAMLHVIRELNGSAGVQILFATGRRDYEQIKAELEEGGISPDRSEGGGNIRVLPYIDRMDLAYAAADVFIGRAGASTLAEITLCGLPAILIPLPGAAENHQAHNAASLADRGGAMALEDRALTGPLLLKAVRELIDDGERRQAMSACSSQAAFKRALEDILDVLADTIEAGGGSGTERGGVGS